MPTSEDQSLATLLTVEQRGELSVLAANTTELIRNELTKSFEISKIEVEADLKQKVEALDLNSKSEGQPISGHVSSDTEQRSITISDAKVQEIRSEALESFDLWRDSVILRIGEVVNSGDETNRDKAKIQANKVTEASGTTTEIHEADHYQIHVDKALTTRYPPQRTSLASLSHGERSTIINAVLLLLLSLESYRAYSRVLLLHLATSMKLATAEITKMEKDVAFGLLTAASHMDSSSSRSAAQKANATARKWKVGLASVAGAALIGVTGGLAAPLVAAGVGGLMGGLGLGATAAAGYLGALAGSGVLVGGLFGAYGGKMTGRMMDAYAKEVEDFAFVPIHVPKTDEKTNEKHRLRVTIGISGWLTKKEDVVAPWEVLGDGGEPFALQFEVRALLALGNAIKDFVSSYAWGYIKKEIIKRTALAGLWSALMLPLGLLKISRLVDNPFSVAKARADKAGEILADALINKAQGERPVSLVGYSLGGRVIYTCLLTLARRKAFGLIEDVVLMGAPVPADAEDWKLLRSVVSGRLVNVFSENDYILSFLYRTSSVQLGVAGLQAIKGIHNVENVDVSESVSGHLRYQYMVGTLLTKIGWPDVDQKALRKETEALEKVIAEETKREAEHETEVAQQEIDEHKLEAEAQRLEAEAPELPSRKQPK